MKAALALFGLLAVAAPRVDRPPALVDLLVLAGEYVRGFQVDLASIIGDEKYQQRVRHIETRDGRDYTLTTERTTLSEMLFLWVAESHGWLAVRNVRVVDRKPVPDSGSRLERMLADPAPGTVGRFRRLRDESARFNIGRINRNFSDPTLPLQFVHPSVQPRFDFTLGDREVVNGVVTWRIAFSERAVPTMITVDNRDALSTGTIWLTPSGVVVRTKIAITDPPSRLRLTMEVTHRRDAKLGGWLPVRMEETYSQRREGGTVREEIDCQATYANYRRFETSARIVPPE
jgi:hypothetical protein